MPDQLVLPPILRRLWRPRSANSLPRTRLLVLSAMTAQDPRLPVLAPHSVVVPPRASLAETSQTRPHRIRPMLESPRQGPALAVAAKRVPSEAATSPRLVPGPLTKKMSRVEPAPLCGWQQHFPRSRKTLRPIDDLSAVWVYPPLCSVQIQTGLGVECPIVSGIIVRGVLQSLWWASLPPFSKYLLGGLIKLVVVCLWAWCLTHIVVLRYLADVRTMTSCVLPHSLPRNT